MTHLAMTDVDGICIKCSQRHTKLDAEMASAVRRGVAERVFEDARLGKERSAAAKEAKAAERDLRRQDRLLAAAERRERLEQEVIRMVERAPRGQVLHDG